MHCRGHQRNLILSATSRGCLAYGYDRFDDVTVSTQVLHAFRWNAAVRITAQLGNWLITIFVMRLLAPADYGLIGLAAILMGLCALVSDLGAIPALIQRPQIDNELVQKIFGLVLLTNGALYLATFVGAPYFAAFFAQPRLVPIIHVIALSLIIEAFSSIQSVLLRRDLKFKSFSLIDFGATMVGSITVLLLALHGWGVWSLVLGGLTRSVCNTLGLVYVTGFRTLPLFNFSGLGELFSFGMRVSTSGIIWYFNRNLDGLLIGKILGDHALGLYSVANNLALLPTTKVIGLTQQIAFSAYSRIQHDRSMVLKYFLESARIASFVFFPVCWGMSAVAPDLVRVALGAKWQSAAIVLQIVALGVPYRAFLLMMDPLVNGVGQPGVSLKNTLTSAGIVPVGLVIGVHWGLVGLCIGSLVGLVISMQINLRRNFAVLGTGYGVLWSTCFPSMLAAAVMYAGVVAARITLFAGSSGILRLVASVAVGVCIYGLMTIAVNRPAAIRSLQIIKGTI